MKKNNPKVAVLGAGYWGKNLVRNFHALGALDLIVDPSPDVQARMNKDYPDVNVRSNYLEAINDPKIKGIVISTPAETHGSLAMEAILAGKDVFVEKPLCLSEDEAIEIINAADEKSCILMVGHLLWYHPAIHKLKELIQEGELGRIQYIYSHRLNMGKLRREENVLWSFAPHDVSMTLSLTGEMPESVYAQGGNYLHKKISDVTVSLLSFPSGIKAHIFVSWLHPFKEQKLVVVGERKMAVFNDTLPWEEKLVLYPHQVEWHGNIPIAIKAEGQNILLSQGEPLRSECDHFLKCITLRKRPITDGREGLSVLKVLNACQRSIELDRTETISQVHTSTEQTFVHPTAVVDPGVTLGTRTRIWHFSHILSASVIGEGCNIGQNVVIGPRCKVGKGCKIQNNVSVYEGVTLEDFVFCGPSAVFTNVYNPRCEIPRMKEMRPTLVKRGATIGANSTIVCGVTIGTYAFVGAGAVVTRDVPDYALMVGNPARRIGWMCMCGERLGDDLICPSCSMAYKESDAGLNLSGK